jgi:hypothetical protein
MSFLLYGVVGLEIEIWNLFWTINLFSFLNFFILKRKIVVCNKFFNCKQHFLVGTTFFSYKNWLQMIVFLVV